MKKILPTQKSSVLDGFTAEFYQTKPFFFFSQKNTHGSMLFRFCSLRNHLKATLVCLTVLWFSNLNQVQLEVLIYSLAGHSFVFVVTF